MSLNEAQDEGCAPVARSLVESTKNVSADAEPVPQSWIEHGDEPAGRGCFYYAATVREDGAELVVRYVHPHNRGVIERRYAAHEGADGLIPAVVAEHGPQAFDVKIPVPSDWPIFDAEVEPRAEDRAIIAKRHDWSGTAFDPETTAGQEGQR